MPDGTQFSVAITATDQYSEALKGFVKNVRGHFREVEKTGKETASKLGEAFEPLSKLAFGGGVGFAGGALGLASMAEGLNRFAEAGTNWHRTSQRIGEDARVLQEFSGATYLAGGAAASGAAGIEHLGQKLHDAAWGRDQQAVAVLRQFGIAARDGNGHVRRASEVLPELAEQIKKLKDPYQQMALAQALLGDAARDYLPFLVKGKEGVQELTEAMRRHGLMDNEAIEAAHHLDRAQRDVISSVTGWSYALAKDLAPSLTKALEGTSKWLDEMREYPAALKAVEIGGLAVSAVFGVTLVAGVAKAVGKLNSFWALPVLQFLLRSGLLAGGAIIAGTTSSGLGGFIPGAQDPALKNAPGPNKPPADEHWLDYFPGGKALRQFFGGGTAASGISGSSPRTGPGGVPTGEMFNYLLGKGASRNLAAGMVANVLHESAGRPGIAGDGGTSGGLFQHHADRFSAMSRAVPNWRENWQGQLDYALREMADNAGLRPRDTSSGSAAGEGFSMSFERPAGGIAEARRRGATAERILQENPQMLPPSVAKEPASSPVMPPFDSPEGRAYREGGDRTGQGPSFLPQVPDYSNSLDSHHAVQVDFANAPPGMKVGLRRAEGPADFGVRVHTAMGGL